MKLDIVIPHNNESEFLDMAKRLGWDGIIFWYPQKPVHGNNSSSFPTFIAAPKSGDLIVFLRDTYDRATIESSPFDIVFGLENENTNDFIHNRASGLNHVLATLLVKKQKAIGFSLGVLLHHPKPSLIIGRMQQNIRLCKKYDVPLCIASLATTPYEMRSPHDLSHFFSHHNDFFKLFGKFFNPGNKKSQNRIG